MQDPSMHSPHDFVFYAPDLERGSTRVDLTGDEHRHLSRVLRMSPGETVFVSNGGGLIAATTIEQIDKATTTLEVGNMVADRSGKSSLTLALACLRKDAFEYAVKQCTELGVSEFLPFVAKKCHIRQYSQNYLDRLRRIALSAMKQSFRATLPSIHEPVELDDIIGKLPEFGSAFVGDTNGAVPGDVPRKLPMLVVVGPEGGLLPDELDRLVESGIRSVSVSPHRLRAETAAAALTSLVALPREP